MMKPKEALRSLLGTIFEESGDRVIPHLNAAGRLLLTEISDPFAPEAPRKRKHKPAASASRSAK